MKQCLNRRYTHTHNKRYTAGTVKRHVKSLRRSASLDQKRNTLFAHNFIGRFRCKLSSVFKSVGEELLLGQTAKEPRCDQISLQWFWTISLKHPKLDRRDSFGSAIIMRHFPPLNYSCLPVIFPHLHGILTFIFSFRDKSMLCYHLLTCMLFQPCAFVFWNNEGNLVLLSCWKCAVTKELQ